MTTLDLAIKVAVLLAFALAAMFLNLKAGSAWLKLLSLWATVGAFGGAGYFVVLLVLA